ncbi:MAG: hypothetical protein AVDCRST_MAG16-2698, partial [uncultured Frankineae bacterium]
ATPPAPRRPAAGRRSAADVVLRVAAGPARRSPDDTTALGDVVAVDPARCDARTHGGPDDDDLRLRLRRPGVRAARGAGHGREPGPRGPHRDGRPRRGPAERPARCDGRLHGTVRARAAPGDVRPARRHGRRPRRGL